MLLQRILSTGLAALLANVLPIAASAQPNRNIAYDEVTPPYNVSVNDVHDFESRYRRISDAMKNGDYISESALMERLENLSNERMRQSNAADKPSIFHTLLSMLPGPTAQIANAVSNRNAGGLLAALAHAIPGAGGLAASEVLGMLPSRAAGAIQRNNRDAAAQLLRASEFERTVGSLKHYSFYNGMERIDDVAGEAAEIIRPAENLKIKLDLHEKRYSTEPLSNDYLLRAMAQSSGGTYEETGVERVKRLQPTSIAGIETEGYNVDRRAQITVTGGCGQNTTTHMTTTMYLSSFADSAPTNVYTNTLLQKCTRDDRVTHDGPSVPTNRLPIFVRIDFPEKNVSLVTERGNVHELTEADEALFEIPAGFTKW